jgi:pyruvate dehydrogenase E1 component alpha subunit
VSIDGTDAAAVHAAMRDAIERARSGGGPSFIEARTVRWPGNKPLWPQLLTGPTDVRYAWDPDRIEGEHATWWREQDGLLRFIRELLTADALSREAIEALDEEARDEMARAMTFALESPYPEPDEALEDVYA